MTEDIYYDTRVRDEGQSRRLRTILFAVIAVLILLLAGMGYFFTTLLVPAGTGDADTGGASGFSWVRSIYGYGSGPGEQLLGPTSVAVGPDGAIYATDPQRGRILVFSADGAFRNAIVVGGTTGEGYIERPESLDVGPDGDLYVVDGRQGKIVVLDSGGTFIREWPAPEVIGVDVVGDEVFTLGIGGARVFSPEGDELFEVAPRGRSLGAELDAVYGITADEERVYVADAHNKSVKAFSRDGELLWVQTSVTEGDPGLSPEEALAQESAPPLTQEETRTADDTDTVEPTETADPIDAEVGVMELPQDLTLDAAGRVVVADAFAFKLVVLDPATGDVLAAYGDVGEADGLLAYPTGIEYDSSRDWFVVADTANDRVQVFRIADSGGGLAQVAGRFLVSPFRYCTIPLALLLLAILLIALSSRRKEVDNLGETT